MVDFLDGGRSKRAIEAQQRRSLAQISQQQGEVDSAASGGGRRVKGRGLLTFAKSLSGEGQSTLG